VAVACGLFLAINFRIVSYSTEARGYAGAICLGVLSSLLFYQLRGTFNSRFAVVYVAASAGASWFLALGMMYPAAHVAICGVWLALAIRKGRGVASEIRLLLTAAWALFASLLVNSIQIPQLIDYSRHRARYDHSPINLANIGNIFAFVTGSGGQYIPAMLVVACSAAGWFCYRRDKLLLAIMLGPGVLQLAAFALTRTPASPRMFVALLLPLALGLALSVSGLMERGRLPWAVALICMAALSSVPKYKSFYNIGNPHLEATAAKIGSDGVVLTGMQADVNTFYFPKAAQLSLELLPSTLPPTARFVLAGVDCMRGGTPDISIPGYQEVDRLNDWTSAESSPQERRPCFLLLGHSR